MEAYLVQPRYRGKSFFLPQLDMPDFVTLPFLRSGRGWVGEMWGEAGGGEREGTVVGMQNEFKKIKIKSKFRLLKAQNVTVFIM